VVHLAETRTERHVITNALRETVMKRIKHQNKICQVTRLK